MSNRLTRILFAAGAVAALTTAAQAQWWHNHPHYLHAMSDLRSAYWLIVHREEGGPSPRPEENFARDQIARAYQDLKDASIMDDKDIRDQPPADMTWDDHRGRLHKALDLLRDARGDVSGEEEDPAARGFRHHALDDIDHAIRATQRAIDVQHWW
jgi:hypothetical protein